MNNDLNVLFHTFKNGESLGSVGVDGRRILKWILQKQGGRAWAGSVLIRIGDKWLAVVNSATNLPVQ